MRERVQTYLEDTFYGGLSEGSRRGIKGSYRAGVGVDFRRDPDTLSALRKLKKDSDTTVDGLVLWMVEAGTDVYMLADNGDLYKRTSGGTYSLIQNFSDSSGEGLALFDDYIYVAGATSLHRYGPLSDSPAVETDFLVSPNVEADQYTALSSANTYTLLTSISETAANKIPFTPTVDSIAGVTFIVVAKGTGDVTVTIHDNSDNEITSKTIAAADMVSSQMRFEFPGAPTITSGGSYHIHITVSTGTTTVRTNTASDLSTAVFRTLRFFSSEDTDQSRDILFNATTQYTIQSAISEEPTHRCTFSPDKSYITAISVMKGSSTLPASTLTLHDSRDNTVGTATLTEAAADSSRFSFLKYTFSSPLKITPTAEYHFHITSSSGTLFSSTADDMETIAFKTHFPILVDSDYHPMLFFPNAAGLTIGNGNFLAFYDGVVYAESGVGTGSERLQFANEEEVRALDLVGDFLAIGTSKGDSVGDHAYSNIYLWDGTTRTYTAFKTIPGEVQAMKTADDGLLYVLGGAKGDIYVYSGALTLVKTQKGIDRNATLETYPGAVTNWESIPRFGISGGTDTTIPRVVHTYGSKSKNYPRSLSADYPISTGNSDSNVTIGALLGLGPSKFFVSWQDDNGGTSYGVDIIDTANDQASVTYETLIFDDGRPDQKKKSSSVRLKYDTLQSGQSITLKYKIDQEASWNTLLTATSADEVLNYKTVTFDEYFHELELQVTLATTGTTGPTLRGLALYFTVDSDMQDGT